MTARVRWRVAGAVAVSAAALLPLGGARWAGVRAERAFAERMTRIVASYLALATPPARGSADYNLGLLLIRARSLVTLPGWTPEVEVYHGTAPLVSPTELPLPAAEFDALRRVETIRWRHGAALVPLKDRDDWDVVGAVALRPAPGEIAPRWVSVWVLAAFALTVWLGVGAARRAQTDPLAWRQEFRRYAAGALALGVITAAAARGAARTATDRSLDDTRLLLQEAGRTPRVTTADLKRLVPRAELARAGQALRGARQLPRGARRSARLDLAAQHAAVRAVRAGDDGAGAGRGAGAVALQSDGAAAAHGVLPADGLVGRGDRAGLAV